MARAKVLVVDDEPYIRELVAQILSEEYQVLLASTGAEALQIAEAQHPDVAVMDIRMPGISGVETCRRLRSNPVTRDIRVVMLTALNDSEQRTEAFEAGADDYVDKPFKAQELLARVTSKVRRAQETRDQKAPETPIAAAKFGRLEIDFQKLLVQSQGQNLDLTPAEFRILGELSHARGKTVSRQELSSAVWGDSSESHRLLDPHVSSLRKKLNPYHFEIKTVYGSGYQLVDRKEA